jgi:SAM-dependent methyltransferase
MKHQIIRGLSSLGVGIRPSASDGISAFGRNIYFFNQPHRASSRCVIDEEMRGSAALNLLSLEEFSTVLDIGAGALEHSNWFLNQGKIVTAVDLGTSVYAEHKLAISNQNFNMVQKNFDDFESEEFFDLVWASHILEHNTNPGHFLKRALKFTKEGGLLVLVLPFPHEKIWGGHVGQWTPGLVTYNLVLAGTSMRRSASVFGHGEFVIVAKKHSIDLEPIDLTMDSGDVRKLKNFLPPTVGEGSSAFATWNNLL